MRLTQRGTVALESEAGAGALGRRLGLASSGLLAVSAILQGAAASQRWLAAAAGTLPPDRTIEDHLFDYVIPSDPWVSVGDAAALFGFGYLLIAASIVCIACASRRPRRRSAAIIVTSAIAALPVVLFGAHAVLSGVLGMPSGFQQLLATYGALVFGVVQVAALIVLAALIVSRSWLWAVALLLLTGTSIAGYICASFVVAPIIVGYQSYDTTPWTEGVLAGSTAAAAILVVVGALRLPSGRHVGTERRRGFRMP